MGQRNRHHQAREATANDADISVMMGAVSMHLIELHFGEMGCQNLAHQNFQIATVEKIGMTACRLPSRHIGIAVAHHHRTGQINVPFFGQ